MKRTKLSRWSGQYRAALKSYLEQESRADMQAARILGDRAAALNLEILDMAKMHDQALAVLLSPGGEATERNAVTAKAAAFFMEAITPIEKTHHPAGKAGMDLSQVNAALARRTLDLTDSHRQLQAGIAGRKEADECLKASKSESSRLLAEARRLQEHLQALARQILTAQEEERKRMSLTLQDEIAQTLLAIHVRLLALDKEVSVSTEAFKKEIAITQRLVQESVNVINRFADDRL